MQDTNNLTIVGRLTKEAELKYSSTGIAILSFTLAVGKYRKDGDYTSFFDCTLLGKEKLKGYLVKGQQIVIQGSIEQQRWEKDGDKKSKVVIIVDSLQLVGNKTEAKENFNDDVPF